MTHSLVVLDQWADANVQFGTSKNWLYNGLGDFFRTSVINADDVGVKRGIALGCLAKAVLARPMDLRREYHRQLEWAAKFPSAFRARTARFQKIFEQAPEKPAAYFQAGCLFGPIEAGDSRGFSYHDQTVAMVERDWPDWLPKHFPRFRDEFFELETASLRAKDIVFTYSAHTRESMINDYGLVSDRVVVAPTACKIEYPDAEAAMAPRRAKLLFASTDFFRKGGDILFDAFTHLRRLRADLELVLVGGASPMPLPDGARHLGLLQHKELREEYLSSCLIVHPARHDAYPNVLKEALACGLPAVASASAGIPEIVRHEETGLILKRLDAASLAEAIDELLSSPSRLADMRENCLRERERFRPGRCVRHMADAMLGVLNRSKGEASGR